ncbi:MAG: O-antigen ligase family protein [Betaproteobacteria bacterium]|nr:O-antigen ligase family protein [Betaproteobacteria bacterium]
MDIDRVVISSAAQQWKGLPVTASLAAALTGIATAIAGSLAGEHAVYYVAVLSFFGIASMLAVTRTEPLRFVFLTLIACFPIAFAEVPPGRLGLTVFDVVMLALAIGLVGKRMFSPAAAGVRLLPTKSLLIAWLLTIPCVVFSSFPWLSLQVLVINFAVQAFFLFSLDELKREDGFKRLALLLSIVTLLMAIGLFIDHFLHVNLSLRGGNLNQLSYVAGMEVWRAGGFFQDPQRAGAFLACAITFLLVLSIRGRFRSVKMRLVVWMAIVAGLAALVTTVSRSAILACLSVSALALFAFNRGNPATKLIITVAVALIALLAALTPVETWLNVFPASVAQRLLQSRTEFEDRLFIWGDTWDMFANHPLTGIGLGSFQSYLAATRPTVFNYYGIGEAAGVVYIPDQPESGYLKILYEGGIAGSVAALLVAGDALRRAISVIGGKNADSDARTEVIAALAGLTTFAITFITLFTVSDKRIAGIFAIFLAVIWHHSLRYAHHAENGILKNGTPNGRNRAE